MRAKNRDESYGRAFKAKGGRAVRAILFDTSSPICNNFNRFTIKYSQLPVFVRPGEGKITG